MTVESGPSTGGRTVCSICQSPVLAGETDKVCESCAARFHAACWQENGGCGTYGCRLAPQAMKLSVVVRTESGSWGDGKLCPRCGKGLESSALNCKFCKAKFDTRAPMTPEDYQAQEIRHTAAKRSRMLAIALFCVSAFGILAPLTLVLSIAWMAAARDMFKRAAGPAEVMVYGSFALSGAYVLLMVVIFVFRW